MIQKSFGLLFYHKKHHGNANVHRPVYLRITVDGVMKEMSIHRTWDPARWNTKAGRVMTDRRPFKKPPEQGMPEAEARAINAYLDTLQAKVHEGRHQLLMSGKPVTAEAVRDFVQGRETNPERPHTIAFISEKMC
jgi:hypothetical protein